MNRTGGRANTQRANRAWRSLANPLQALASNDNPGALYRRIRLTRTWLPPIVAMVVVLYQLYVVRVGGSGFEFWAALLFYGLVGPIATFLVMNWIASEVLTRERAESDLRRLYLELSEAHKRLATVQDVTRRVSEQRELDAVLSTAISCVVEAVGARAGAITLEGGIVRTDRMPQNALPLEVLDLEPLRHAQNALERPSGWPGAASRISVPLRWGGRFLGAVHVYLDPLPPEETRDFLEVVTGELAAAIEAVEHRTRDWLTLFEVDKSIRAEPNLERLLARILERIGERTSADAAGVYLTDEAGRLSLAVGHDADGRPARNRAAGPLARLAAKERAPQLVPDLNTPPEALQDEDGQQADPILHGTRAAVAIPLTADSELVGVIVLGQRHAGALDERELPLLSLLANQVTLAARNARAYLYGEELAIIEERSRIAREIHDGIAQSLAFTALKLDLANRLIDSDSERARNELHAASSTLREQIREVRRSIFALRPVDLEHHGFQETVRRYVSDFGAQNDLRATLEVSGEPRLTSADEVALFRILQEALNNVAKHARARNVRVTVRSDAAITRLTVEDDGRGFDPASLTGVVSTAGGLGLTQMRERLEARGGRFTFDSSPGNGTRVVATLPTSGA